MSNYSVFSDEELIKKYKEADANEEDSKEADAIVEYLMNKYKPLVRKQTNALYLIGGEKDDLVQEGMIGLFKAVRDYSQDKNCSFFYFAQVCISNQLSSALKASNRLKHSPLNGYVSLSTEDENQSNAFEKLLVEQTETNPELLVIRQELWLEFKQKLADNLSKLENTTLALYLEGKSYTEIAEILDKTPKSIDNALQRIRQKVENLKKGENYGIFS